MVKLAVFLFNVYFSFLFNPYFGHENNVIFRDTDTTPRTNNYTMLINSYRYHIVIHKEYIFQYVNHRRFGGPRVRAVDLYL